MNTHIYIPVHAHVHVCVLQTPWPLHSPEPGQFFRYSLSISGDASMFPLITRANCCGPMYACVCVCACTGAGVCACCEHLCMCACRMCVSV